MRRAVALVAVGVLWSGCALFTKPADTVTFNRGQFALVAIRVAEMHGSLVTLAALACGTSAGDGGQSAVRALCGELSKAETRYQEIKPDVERAITNPGLEPNWENITKGLTIITSALVAVAPLLGAAGLPVLGALPGLVGPK